MVIKKIFMISADDSLANRITACLTVNGYHVRRISRGIGAIDRIQLEKPVLIILDVNIPDFNSLAIIRTLRAEDKTSAIPLILIGVNMHEEDALMGLEVGADLCLRETFHPQVFVARVHALLRRAAPLKTR